MPVNLPGNRKESTQQSLYVMVGIFLGSPYHGDRSESNSLAEAMTGSLGPAFS